MDHLKGYSSDSSTDETKDTQKTITTLPPNSPPNSPPNTNSTTTNSNTNSPPNSNTISTTTNSTTNSTTTNPSLPTPIDYPLFSLNYANMNRLHTLYVYVPWSPPAQTIAKFTQIRDKLKTHFPHTVFASCHPRVGYHVSLSHNISAEPYKIQQVSSNIKSAIRNMKIRPQLMSVPANIGAISRQMGIPIGKRVIRTALQNVAVYPGGREGYESFVAVDLARDESRDLWAALGDIVATNLHAAGLASRKMEWNHVSFASCSEIDRERLREVVGDWGDMGSMEFDRVRIEVRGEGLSVEEILLNELDHLGERSEPS